MNSLFYLLGFLVLLLVISQYTNSEQVGGKCVPGPGRSAAYCKRINSQAARKPTPKPNPYEKYRSQCNAYRTRLNRFPYSIFKGVCASLGIKP